MRLLINLVLVAIIAGLIWVLISSIREPIAFKAEKEKREQAVIAKLRTIRTVQEAYRNITGVFAPDFDQLSETLKEGKFAIISVIGDPDDPNFTGEIIYDTTFMSALDSMNALGINLDSLKYVPYGKGANFEMQADTIDYQKTSVPVLEVGVKRKVFMGRFADARFSRYDNTYDPNSILKFGNLGAPNLSGNWGE